MAKLSVGSKVEVACEDDGYLGSWFDATIIGHEGNKFTIEYENLLEEDMRSPCKERVKMSQVRPRPPQLPEDDPGRWLPGHAVEAHWHDGWWQGVIDKRLAKDSFQVYFQNTSERLTFSAKNIRTRMDWGEGGWVVVTAVHFILCLGRSSDRVELWDRAGGAMESPF